MRALTIVCGMLALAAAASAQAVANVPPSGERVTFANDPSVATTGAISIVDADGWTWVVYGTTAGLSWYNASCGMQGVPLEASFSQTGCFATTTMASPVSSLGKFNASNFFAVAGDSIAIFTGKTAGNVISAPGAIFDLAVTAYPSNQQRLAPGPTVVNGFLYIGTQNLTLGGTMSMVHKINLVTGTMVWSQAVAWANSNYPVTVGTINGVSTVIATSASPSIAVFTPIMDSTGALGNASFVTSVVESACAGWSYCNQTQFGVAIVNDLVWIVSSQMYHRIIVWSPATQQWASTSSQSTNTNTQFLSVVDGWLLLGQNTYVYAVNASAMPMSALTSTTGSIPSSIIFQAQTTSGGWYSSYVQAVFVVNNTLYAAHQCGIDAININTLLAGGTPTMSAWWTYWSTAASSSYSTCGRLQMAWMDVMTPTTLYVTYGTLGSSYTQGSTWAFDMAKNMSLWRFGDNYNALGGSIWVMPKGLSTGLWFGATAGASAGPYGRRTLLGWTASSMQGSVTLNVATSSTNPTMAYSNVSGMLMVSNGYNFTIYNASTLQLFATVQSTGNYFQAYGFVTVGTWHCAVTTYTMHCLDFKMGNSSSYTVSNSFYNVPIVAGNRYIIAWHYSNGVVVLDTWATAAAFSDPLPKGGSSWVVGQVAASIVQDTLVVAVTYDTGKMRVYYGATGAVYTEIAGGTAAGVTKSVSLTSNAVIQNGYAVASATVTSTSTVTSSTTTGFIFVPLTTVPVSLATAPTAAETVAWIYGSQEDSGTLQTVFASPNDPTMVYGLSASNLTGWSTKTMKPVFTVQPPVNTSFLTATRRQPTSQYWPTVDNTTGLLIIGLNDANSGTFTAYGLFGPNDGALEGLVGVKVTGSSWTPPATPQFSGNGLVYPSVTHICDGSVSPWNFSWPMNGIDSNDRRVCTTIDGVTTTDGFAVANNTFYLLVGGNVLTASRVDATGYYTRLYVAGAAGGNNGNGGGSSTGDDGGSGSSKAPIIIGIIVAVVVVALVGFVVFKKMGSSGGSSGQSGVNYSEMSTKKV